MSLTSFPPSVDGHFAGCDEPFSHDVWPLTAQNLLSEQSLLIRASETRCDQSKILEYFHEAVANLKANNGKGTRNALSATSAALESTLVDESATSSTAAAGSSKGKKASKKGESTAPNPQPQPQSTLGAESMSQVAFNFQQFTQVPETLVEENDAGEERDDEESEVGDMLNGQQIVLLPDLLYSAVFQPSANQTSTLVPEDTLSESQSQSQSQQRTSKRKELTKVTRANQLSNTLVESQPTPVVISKTADTGSTPSDISVEGAKRGRGRSRKLNSQEETQSPLVPNGQPTQPAIPTSIEVPMNRNKATEEALILSGTFEQNLQ